MSDVEFITPPRHISQKVGKGIAGFDAPLLKAERALAAQIQQTDYRIVAKPKIDGMRAALKALHVDNDDRAAWKGLVEIVHDFRGEAASFRQFAVAEVLSSFKSLLTVDRTVNSRFIQIASLIVDGLSAMIAKEIGRDEKGPAAPVVKGLGDIANSIMPAWKHGPRIAVTYAGKGVGYAALGKAPPATVAA